MSAQLELIKVLTADVNHIKNSRAKSKIVHRTRDIDASGDEVEIPVREIIKKWLPKSCYVGHGHIVDSKLNTSSQFDVIISEGSETHILFEAENGTEYFAYENIFAFGEIKSTYTKSKEYIKKFANVIAETRSNLSRKQTPKSYLGNGIHLGNMFTTNSMVPYKNPLYTFMVFVDSGDFKIEDIKELYKTTDHINLPNAICLLDQGVILNSQVIRELESVSLGPINNIPEFRKTELENRWSFIPFGTNDTRDASNLGFLMFSINEHVKCCTLMPPNLMQYFEKLFLREEGDIIDIN